MITFITGSLTCCDPDAVANAVAECGFPVTAVVLGGGRGVGQMAEQYARSRGLAGTVQRPDWVTHGRVAPSVRDSRVLEQVEALIIINPAGLPEGRQLVAEARRLGKAVYEHHAREGPPPRRHPGRPSFSAMVHKSL